LSPILRQHRLHDHKAILSEDPRSKGNEKPRKIAPQFISILFSDTSQRGLTKCIRGLAPRTMASARGSKSEARPHEGSGQWAAAMALKIALGCVAISCRIEQTHCVLFDRSCASKTGKRPISPTDLAKPGPAVWPPKRLKAVLWQLGVTVYLSVFACDRCGHRIDRTRMVNLDPPCPDLCHVSEAWK